MKRQIPIRKVDLLLGPPLLALSFAGKILYKAVFSWWYDPWNQRMSNERLWYDVRSTFQILASKGHLIEESPLIIHPFNYASIRIAYDNLCFRFTRGRDEVNISLSPASSPDDSHHLDTVIAALESKESAEIEPIDSLYEASQIVNRSLDALNEAFSPREYVEFRKRLLNAKESERIGTRQLEWELNQHLYGKRH